jgi:hypothetical protein
MRPAAERVLRPPQQADRRATGVLLLIGRCGMSGASRSMRATCCAAELGLADRRALRIEGLPPPVVESGES